MSEGRGFPSCIFDDCSILWFVILFLLLFWRNGYEEYGVLRDNPMEDTGLIIE